jgi:1-acyl-sn-glycerol-3-phosphate acyltransferase
MKSERSKALRRKLVRPAWAVLLLLSTPILLYIKILHKLGFQRVADRVITRSSKFILKQVNRILGCRIIVSGLENIPPERPLLFVSNHQGHMDSSVLHQVIPTQTAFISIVASLKIPVMRSWMKEMHCVFMDRDNMRQSAQCILDAIELVKAGYNMVVFPEGRTSGGPMMNEFKRGSFQLAFRNGATIVPISINNSYKMMGYHGEVLDPATVTVTFSKPVPTAGVTKEGEKAVIDKVISSIAANLP